MTKREEYTSQVLHTLNEKKNKIKAAVGLVLSASVWFRGVPFLLGHKLRFLFTYFHHLNPSVLKCFLHMSFQKDYKAASPGIRPSLAGRAICGVVWQPTLNALQVHCECPYLVSLVSAGLIWISGTKENTILDPHAPISKCIPFLSLALTTRFRILIITWMWSPKFTTHLRPADLSQLFSYSQRLST